MSKKATEFQKIEMGKIYYGKEIWKPLFLTGRAEWTNPFAFAFMHKDKHCAPFQKRGHKAHASYDAYNETDGTVGNAKSGFRKGVGR